MAFNINDVLDANGLVVMVYGKGILEGPSKLSPEDKETIVLSYDTKDAQGNIKSIVRNVEINHKSKLPTIVSKRIELLPFQIQAMITDCPSNIPANVWKGMNAAQKFEKSISLFDEGYGLDYEFVF